VDTERERLRASFDTAARTYDAARPDYPSTLFDALVRAARLRPGDHLLEVGCGTGKATVPLARRGFRITALELGPRLAEAARERLAVHPDVRVLTADFESWHPRGSGPQDGFDLVYAATAWHWLDPLLRHRRAWDLLRPAGHLAFWSATHVFPVDGDPFFADLQQVYEEIGEARPSDTTFTRPGELPDEADEVERSGLFDVVAVQHFDWENTYDADGYLRLLDTFSGHIAMEPAKREHLYREIRRRLAGRPDGRLRRHWGAVLHVARRRG
jgi:SAM-dependent methyltransferase